MARVKLIPQIKFRYTDSNGNPLVGGKVYTYITGTNTPQDTYSNSGGSVLNANPVILDARGECDIYLIDGLAYRITVTDANDVEIETTDNVLGASPTASDNWINLQDFGAVGDGVVDDTLAIQAAVVAATTSPRPTLYCPAGNYKFTDTITINGKISMVGDGMNATTFTFTNTTAPAFTWSADGSYSYFKGIKVFGPGRVLGQTATGFVTYQGSACVFYVWEQCWIENFPMWGIDLNDSFNCKFTDGRLRRNGVTASLGGLGLNGQGGGMRMQRITFTGAATTGNDFTNNYITGNNWGVQIEPSGSNNKAFNTRFDNCIFEENWIGVDLRNLGSGSISRYCFLNTCYGEANIFAMAMLDEGTSIACYQNDTTSGTGTPPSTSYDGPDGINFSARFVEDRPSRFRVGNFAANPGDRSMATAFSIDKGAATNYISFARFAQANALKFGYAGITPADETTISSGGGNPEASLTANVGSLFLRNDGSTIGQSLYVKTTTDATNTGWIPLGPASGNTGSRPTPSLAHRGQVYFDTTIGRAVFCDGVSDWVEFNGATLAVGTYANIPAASATGATYFATDLTHQFVSDGVRWRSVSLPTRTSSFSSGGSTTVSDRGETLINTNVGTIATHTVVFPDGSDAVSGDTIIFATAGTITSLNVNPAGSSTILNQPSTLAAGTSIEYRYNDFGSGTWYRIR